MDSASYIPYWDVQAQSAWLYNSTLGVTISYEDPDALRAKANYVRAIGLGGMMFWELAYDDDNHTLTTILHQELRNTAIAQP